MLHFRLLTKNILLICLTVWLSACGGGGGGGATTQPAATIDIGGKVDKGPVRNATIEVFEINADGSIGVSLGTVTSDSSGAFDFNDIAKSITNCFLIEVSGGTYRDEVTQTDVIMASNEIIRAMFCTTADPIGPIAITPLTELAASRALQLIADGGEFRISIESSNSGVGQQFFIADIINLPAVDATDSNDVDKADRNSREYGLLLGGISQLALNLNLSAIELTRAMAEDLRDGVLDGVNGSTAVQTTDLVGGSASLPTDMINQLVNANTQFFGSGVNQTNLQNVASVVTTPNIGVGSATELRITTTAVPAWISGQFASFQFDAAGGTAPYTWTANSGPPFGFSFSNLGLLSGIAPVLSGGTTSQLLGFSVSVTDANNNTVTLETTVPVISPSPTAQCETLPDATEGTAYTSLGATATGGNPPYSFKQGSFIDGTLPFGMLLDINGNVTGTPSNGTAGMYNFQVCAVDLVGGSDCCNASIDVIADNNTGPGGTGDDPIVTITSAVCEVLGSNSFGTFAKLTISGTASGPVQTDISESHFPGDYWSGSQFSPSPFTPTGEDIEAFSCGVWGESATSIIRPDGIDSPECERQTGQPVSTTWQFVRPAQFGFFLQGTDTDVIIVSNGPGVSSSVDTDSITVTCQ